MEYLWTEGLDTPFFPPLQGNERCDVLVIGAGMAGILCALELKSRGIDCIVAEAAEVGSGVTRGTTAVLSAQHDTLYQDLVKSFGEENAKLYLQANLEAVLRFEKLSKNYPCDFEKQDSYMYTRKEPGKLEEEVRVLNKLGFEAEFTNTVSLPFRVSGAVRFPEMAQFHPLKLLYSAAKDLKIYCNTQVEKISGKTAYTTGGKIKAEKFIAATHFPFINAHGMYFMKLYQMRSFVVALENSSEIDGTYSNLDESDLYFRRWSDLLLIGGGDRRVGTKGGGFEEVRRFIRRHYPNSPERFSWAAQDCISLDGVPYIGQYSPNTPDLYVASGFNEWGMTSSMAASQIIADLIEDKENPFAAVFDPQRSMPKSQLMQNAAETAKEFAFPTLRRCSHMGCALRWNEEEQSWDCPCHGSRFTENGELINSPAQKDAIV